MTTATRRHDASPPRFLQLAGHDVRWRLLSELARSDRRVSELCGLLDLPQNLVSYHLGRLRAGDLVARRRSSADGRDSYYVLALDRCSELLADTGAALHPGLRLNPAPARPAATAGSPRPPARVLFLCTGNSARSQIAEALLEHMARGAARAQSAGSHPKPLHPRAVHALREWGLDISGRRSKHLDEFTGERFDFVISLCDRVREVCPKFPGHPDQVHWSIPDPARATGSDAEVSAAFERTTNELATRISFLTQLIAATNDTPGGE